MPLEELDVTSRFFKGFLINYVLPVGLAFSGGANVEDEEAMRKWVMSADMHGAFLTVFGLVFIEKSLSQLTQLFKSYALFFKNKTGR